MKKFLLIVLILICIPIIVQAKDIEVRLNGITIDFTDEMGNKVNPQIINNRTMVPMRKIFETLGASIDWNDQTRTVTAVKDGITIKLQINNKKAECIENGVTKQIQLDSEPVILNNRTMVPVRFIAESLKKQVDWDDKNRVVIIGEYNEFLNRVTKISPFFSELIRILESNKEYKKVSDMTITYKYTDLLDNSIQTSIANFKIDEIVANNICKQNVIIKFSGNGELAKEIISEGWGDADLILQSEKDIIRYTTNNSVLAKILGVTRGQYKEEKLSKLNLNGGEEKSFEDFVLLISGVDKRYSLEVNSFYENLPNIAKIFNISNVTESNGVYSLSFNIDDKFDLSRIDDIFVSNTYIRICNFLNKKIFNFDFDLKKLTYETLNFKLNGDMKFTIQDGKLKTENINIKLEKTNIYDEKFEYLINIIGGVE